MTIVAWVLAGLFLYVALLLRLSRLDLRDEVAELCEALDAAEARQHHATRGEIDLVAQLRDAERRLAAANAFLATLGFDHLTITEKHDDPA